VRRLLLAVLVPLAIGAGLAGCSSAPAGATGSGDPSVQLAARLATPTSVVLSWRDDDRAAVYRSVEYATDPGGPYTVLGFVPGRQTTFTHPDLMPQTVFYYRLRPVYGPESGVVDVTLPAGPFDENAHQDDPDWAAPRVLPRGAAGTQSVRQPGAAPTDLAATVMDANGIRFTWTDHASGEQGYLLEVRPAGAADFGVAATLDPDVNSFGLVTLPDEKHASYRVRAYYYGNPSTVAHATTGDG
jgi:hypothetical protein